MPMISFVWKDQEGAPRLHTKRDGLTHHIVLPLKAQDACLDLVRGRQDELGCFPVTQEEAVRLVRAWAPERESELS